MEVSVSGDLSISNSDIRIALQVRNSVMAIQSEKRIDVAVETNEKTIINKNLWMQWTQNLPPIFADAVNKFGLDTREYSDALAASIQAQLEAAETGLYQAISLQADQVAQQIALIVQNHDTLSGIVDTKISRADMDAAMALSIESNLAAFAANVAQTYISQLAFATEMEAKTAQIESARSEVLGSVALNYVEKTTYTTDKAAISNSINDVSASVGDAEARITNSVTTQIQQVNTNVSQQLSNLSVTLGNTVNVDAAQYAIDMANMDGKITAEENARINAILSEQQARASAISDQIAALSLVDGKITTEEQARIDAVNAVTTAYQNYVSVVRQALIDGEITTAEQNAIDTAAVALETARSALLGTISDTDLALRYLIGLDGTLQAALSDGLVTFYTGAQPIDASAYDIWEVSADQIEIGVFSASSLEVIANSAESTFYFYLGPDGIWAMCTANQTAFIKKVLRDLETFSLADSKARIFTVQPYPPYDVGDLWIANEIRLCDYARTKDEIYTETDWMVFVSQATIDAITAEAAARGADVTALTAAYENYVTTVRQALIDGEITNAEQSAIDTAAAALNSALNTINNTFATVKSQATMMNTVTLPDGTVVTNGWQSLIEYAEGIVRNIFAIMAENFYIASPDGAYQPFQINTTTGEILFNGKVLFTSIQDMPGFVLGEDIYTPNTSTIDGGKITTKTIDVSSLSVINALVGGEIVSGDYSHIGGLGFRLKSNAAGTSTDPTIYGAYIKGSVVDTDSIISGSLTSNTITDIPIPSTYISGDITDHIIGYVTVSNLNGQSQLIVINLFYELTYYGVGATYSGKLNIYRGTTIIASVPITLGINTVSLSASDFPFEGTYYFKVTANTNMGQKYYGRFSTILFKK